MKKRALFLIAVLVMAVGLAGCGGDDDGGAQQGPVRPKGRPSRAGSSVGSINYIDSLNPFNYIESQAYQAMLMIFPQLVQYATSDDGLVIEGDWAESWETSTDGKDWTISSPAARGRTERLHRERRGLDDQHDARVRGRSDRGRRRALLHVDNAEAVDDNTLVIHYEAPVGNVLAQLEQLFIVPSTSGSRSSAQTARASRPSTPSRTCPSSRPARTRSRSTRRRARPSSSPGRATTGSPRTRRR